MTQLPNDGLDESAEPDAIHRVSDVDEVELDAVDAVDADALEAELEADAADEDAEDAAFDDVVLDDTVTDEAVLDDGLDADDDLLVLEESQIELPVWEQTGDAEVDAAVELLGRLEDADLAGHVETFAEVHRRLRQRLTDVASS